MPRGKCEVWLPYTGRGDDARFGMVPKEDSAPLPFEAEDVRRALPCDADLG